MGYFLRVYFENCSCNLCISRGIEMEPEYIYTKLPKHYHHKPSSLNYGPSLVQWEVRTLYFDQSDNNSHYDKQIWVNYDLNIPWFFSNLQSLNKKFVIVIVFGSVRSSRNHNLRLFVRPVQTCLELSIFIFVAQISSSFSHQISDGRSLK